MIRIAFELIRSREMLGLRWSAIVLEIIRNSVRDDPQRLHMKEAAYGSSWSVSFLRIKLIRNKHTDQVDFYAYCKSTWSVRSLRINLIRMKLTDQLDPQEAYGSTWSLSLLRINLICMLNINIRINLIRINLTDQLYPYKLQTTLTHTQHKCVPRMSPTKNQPPQQWTPAPPPSPIARKQRKYGEALRTQERKRRRSIAQKWLGKFFKKITVFKMRRKRKGNFDIFKKCWVHQQ